MRIIGGMVSYGHGKKDDPNDQYSQSKKAIVELRFDVAEDGDETAMLNRASALALAKVNELVGIKTAAPVASTAEPAAPLKATKPRTSKKAEGTAAAAPVATPATGSGDAEIIGGDVASPQPKQTDVEDFIIDAEPAVQISDADLKSACAKTAQKLGDGGAVKVKEWAAKFRKDATKAFQVADIAQAERQKFLDGLEKLT